MVSNHYINGEWVTGSGDAYMLVNPSTGDVAWEARSASHSDIQNACAAARASFSGWAQTSLDERIAVCTRFRDLLHQHQESLAHLIYQETGKPHWEARTEVASMANKVDISIDAYSVRTSEVKVVAPEGHTVIRHRPHGVMGVLGPYNFPGHLPNGHIVPALIAGNAVVFKPSELAPQTAIRIVELWVEAGIPRGVLNLVNGDKRTGHELSNNKELDGILFTGSYQTGASLHQQFAGQPEILLALEMGGNNPLIVWDVSNIEAAVYHTIMSAFISAGQRCTCARRLIVPDSAWSEQFLERLVQVASTLRIANSVPDMAFEEQPFMGPITSMSIANELVLAQEMMFSNGGKSLLAMRSLKPNLSFLSPGIIDVTHAIDIPDKEWFGPLLQVIRVKNFSEAMNVANRTAYGLSAGLLSDDETLWKQYFAVARAGIVNWNRPTTGASSRAPFGGIGHSGNHRPSAYYAADYCAYPVASTEAATVTMPLQRAPGIIF